MGRLCSVCHHPQRDAIDLELARHEDGYRAIAARWAVAESSLKRHERAHLKTSWQRIKGMHNVLAADNLLHALADLDQTTREILDDACAHIPLTGHAAEPPCATACLNEPNRPQAHHAVRLAYAPARWTTQPAEIGTCRWQCRWPPSRLLAAQRPEQTLLSRTTSARRQTSTT